VEEFSDLANMAELLAKYSKRESEMELRRQKNANKEAENGDDDIPEIPINEYKLKRKELPFTWKTGVYYIIKYIGDFIDKRQSLELERENAGYADLYVKKEIAVSPEVENKKKIIWRKEKEKTCEDLKKLRGLSMVYSREDRFFYIN
jgi:hypothetical protein